MLLIAGGLAVASLLRAADPAPVPPDAGLSKEAAADFEWFGTLGFPDLRGCQMAHVEVGGNRRYGKQEFTEQFLDGFLLRQGEGGRFAVVTPELNTREFTTTPGTAETFPVGFVSSPLAEAAIAHAGELEKATKDPAERMGTRFGQQLSERGQAFVWAWACRRNGLDELAARFYNLAATVKVYHRNGTEPATLRERLEQDLGYVMIWRATLDFENPAIPRTQLLGTFERVAHDYPPSEYADRARDTAGRLREMVAEDAAHAAGGGSELESLPVEKRVAELIFRLRDQNGRQIMQPGSCDVFIAEDFKGEGKAPPSPAGRLAELGNAAVPALIAALDDQRFSRSVGYWRNFSFSHHVLTVGDCAEQILERIAGKRLFTARTTSSYPSKDGDIPAVKAKAEAWWKELQTNGERKTLIDAVSAGDEDGYRQTERLRKRYPDDALAAFVAGLKKARGWARAVYVREIGSVPGDEALAFLQKEMRDDADASARVAAASAVARRGHGDEAVAAMVTAWEGTRDWRKGEEVEVEDAERWKDEPFFGVIQFLARSGRVDAVRALGSDLRARPVNLRMDVARVFDLESSRTEAESEGKDAAGGQPGQDEPAKVAAAVEALLAAELEDTQIRPGYGGRSGEKSLVNVRVCDAAAGVLARRLPGKYVFDPEASPKRREEQRVACLNAWRTARGEAALPLPTGRRVEPAADAVAGPLLRAVAAGQDDAVTRTAIEKLGLSALEPLQGFAASLPPDDRGGRARLATVKKTLACTVAETKLDGLAIANDADRREVQERLDAWRGKPLTAGDLAACAAWLGGKIPRGWKGSGSTPNATRISAECGSR